MTDNIEESCSYVFLNGRILPRAEAAVSAFDRGLLYGDGIFETMRAYETADGRPGVFRLDDHLHRMRSSADELRIDLPLSSERIAEAVKELIELNRLANAYVRISLTRGCHTGSLALDTGRPPTLLIDCRPLHAYPEEWYADGIGLATAESRRSRSALAPRHKSLSYIENLLILDRARQRGSNEALILTEDGFVCEGATSNIFWVDSGVVRTPSEEANQLSGITRAVVIEICSRLGVRVEEGLFPPSRVAAAEEAFITNSIMEVMPVAEVDGKRLKSCPGELTTVLRQEYAGEVRRYLEGRAR